jgi:hypothetical protein
MINLRQSMALPLLLSLAAFAQSPRPEMGERSPGFSPMGPGDFAFVRGEFGIANQVVKGAPYTANAITELTRTLADGNRIQRTTTALVARDSEGRTRTERTLAAIGPLAASARGAWKAIFINDPVAGRSYVLDPNKHTARQMPVPFGSPARNGPSRFSPQSIGPSARAQPDVTRKTEDLGAQTIQGLNVQGRRISRTIPAGAVGNQRAIDSVTEIWYSPDLKAIVVSKTNDPRFGESLYQLTDINRAEPDRALFSVPQGYTLEEGRADPGAARTE